MPEAPDIDQSTEPALPPLPSHMVMMTPEMVMPLRADSFASVAGFDAVAYRDLGIENFTDSGIGVTISRNMPGRVAPTTPWHVHHADLVVYVLKGSAVLEFEGVGKVTYEPGMAIFQPAYSRHRELEMSEDLELLIVTRPGGPLATTLFIYDESTGEYTDFVIDFEDLVDSTSSIF